MFGGDVGITDGRSSEEKKKPCDPRFVNTVDLPKPSTLSQVLRRRGLGGGAHIPTLLVVRFRAKREQLKKF